MLKLVYRILWICVCMWKGWKSDDLCMKLNTFYCNNIVVSWLFHCDVMMMRMCETCKHKSKIYVSDYIWWLWQSLGPPIHLSKCNSIKERRQWNPKNWDIKKLMKLIPTIIKSDLPFIFHHHLLFFFSFLIFSFVQTKQNKIYPTHLIFLS